jgi:hypothetical protein
MTEEASLSYSEDHTRSERENHGPGGVYLIMAGDCKEVDAMDVEVTIPGKGVLLQTAVTQSRCT